jgi:hypothetical protein
VLALSGIAAIRELERGTWLDDTVSRDTQTDLQSLCQLLADCVADLVVCLSMFDEAYAQPRRRLNNEERRHDAERQHQREDELTARAAGWPDESERQRMIADQARRDVLREKWARQGGPWEYQDRLVWIHASSFLTSLALLQRGLEAVCSLALGEEVRERLKHARDAFACRCRLNTGPPAPV